MIYHAPINFLGDPVVVAPIAGFQVKYRNAHASRDECRQAAIGVSQNQQPIGFLTRENDRMGGNSCSTALLSEQRVAEVEAQQDFRELQGQRSAA